MIDRIQVFKDFLVGYTGFEYGNFNTGVGFDKVRTHLEFVFFVGERIAAVIVFLGYQCYESIMVPQRFETIKKQRYDRIIQKLKDIRTAQEAYRTEKGKYTASFDTLINFIKYDSVKIIRSIGQLTDEQLEAGMTKYNCRK